MPILSHNTADKSCSCWILSFHSPSVIQEWERSASPEGAHRPMLSLLLSTPSTQRDHTALLKTAGPWKHQQRASSHLSAVWQQQNTVHESPIPWCLLHGVSWKRSGPSVSVDPISAKDWGQWPHCCSRWQPKPGRAAHTTQTGAHQPAAKGQVQEMIN